MRKQVRKQLFDLLSNLSILTLGRPKELGGITPK